MVVWLTLYAAVPVWAAGTHSEGLMYGESTIRAWMEEEFRTSPGPLVNDTVGILHMV